MMTNQHSITPPPELVKQWHDECHKVREPFLLHIANQAAQWGADQELEACCKWLECNYNYPQANPLRIARRPKPPSLKEQALTALSHLLSGSAQTLDTTEAEFYICRALEALPND